GGCKGTISYLTRRQPQCTLTVTIDGECHSPNSHNPHDTRLRTSRESQRGRRSLAREGGGPATL
ncbi:MAG TPA: hypothetical protein VFN30_04285, partial [Chitinophagaceae bacterium]|nr:hypothetical protein [Chitinophagaceae bacterium]